MKKRIVVGQFHDGYEAFYVGGRKNVNLWKKSVKCGEDYQFIGEKTLVIDVPGVIIGTPEEWNILFNDRISRAYEE